MAWRGDEEGVEQAAGVLLGHGSDESAVVSAAEEDVLVGSVEVEDGQRRDRPCFEIVGVNDFREDR